MKSSHLSTLPETISNHGRSLLLTLSVLLFHPGIVKPRTCGSMLSMKNLQLDPTYAEPLEPDLLVSLVLGFTSPSPVRRLCQSTPLSRLSPSPDRVTNASHRLHPTPASFLTCLYATDYTPNIEAAPSHQGFYGAKLHRLDLRLLVTTGPIVQECCFARFPHEVFTVASLSHYAVSSIDGSSQNRICGLPDLLVAGTIVQDQIGLSSLNVVYGSGASHLKFLPINIPTSSYRCFNVVFDYQLFFRTIAMGTKVKLLFGFLHFVERDSPLYGSISSFSVLVSSFILPSSRAPGLSASVVNVVL
ncbi:unnamed protein product [Brassica rapa]|uniref:Uncharacterized protein n=1 Tax=Brassica campestris TaxID=3711 RepID=A0A8D9GHE1_BRACM|nr:unnamed protein product [Brassica rapa]